MLLYVSFAQKVTVTDPFEQEGHWALRLPDEKQVVLVTPLSKEYQMLEIESILEN